MKRNRLAKINGPLARTGFRLQHDSGDPLLREIQDLPELLRLNPEYANAPEMHLARLSLQFSLRRILAARGIGLVIDVGANEGQFASMLRAIGYQETIMSLEPGAPMFDSLNRKLEPGAKQINVCCLVGGECGMHPFSVSKGSEFSSLHAPSQEGKQFFDQWMEGAPSEQVAMMTIDRLMSDHPIPADSKILLKTDTQGHDMEVLRGANATLLRTTAVLIEYPIVRIYDAAPTGPEITLFLEQQGFRMAGFYPITKVPGSEALLECDALFVRD